jgi:hypothetical protein
MTAMDEYTAHTARVNNSERVMSAPAGAFGPFRPDTPELERVAGLRALAAFVSVYCGADHVVVDLLRHAEADAAASSHALAEFDRLPSLRRRHVIAAYARLVRPRRWRS